ncbi:MAG: MipA/OmpV family protein [Proteobacteria bacterium]|nr:MipA/OmpV family protein [Pseudomonadota bacterium]
MRLLLTATIAISGLASNGRADESDTTSYHISVGPAFYTMPRYPGSQGSRTRPFPFVDAEYDNRYYTSVSDIFGVYAFKTDSAQAGAALEFDPTERIGHRDAKAHNLRSIRDTTRLKLFASKTILFVTADGNVATDILGHGQGTLAQGNLWFTAPLGAGFSINVGPGATWADTRYMHSFFSTHAGILDTHLNGLVEWQFLSHYRVGVLAYLARLQGDAAASPVVQQRAQRTVVGWVAYKFR